MRSGFVCGPLTSRRRFEATTRFDLRNDDIQRRGLRLEVLQDKIIDQAQKAHHHGVIFVVGGMRFDELGILFWCLAMKFRNSLRQRYKERELGSFEDNGLDFEKKQELNFTYLFQPCKK